jgi:hypothetical protein
MTKTDEDFYKQDIDWVKYAEDYQEGFIGGALFAQLITLAVVLLIALGYYLNG